jgi:hypothetical protein
MMNLFLVAAITSVLDIPGATAAGTGAALPRCSRLIEFNDPRCDHVQHLDV